VGPNGADRLGKAGEVSTTGRQAEEYIEPPDPSGRWLTGRSLRVALSLDDSSIDVAVPVTLASLRAFEAGDPNRGMSSQAQEDRLVVYSDYVCPFCYLGKAAMEQYLDSTADPPAVDWQFYDLRGYKRQPDGSIDENVDDGKDDDYFADVRDNVAKLKEEYDVEMALDFSLDVDSWNAQQVALYVREGGRSTGERPAQKRAGNDVTREQELGEDEFLELHERLFDALWQDGLDVGDPDVLRDVVADAGLDESVVEEALTDEWDERLRERFDTAQQAGVRGIPTFVYGEHAARGAIPPAQFERLVDGA
jgi:predicted DsbA family dithiol-disulfide isomerase